MNRMPMVAGNWKMNKTIDETRLLITDMVGELNSIKGVERVLFPPFISLHAAAALLEGTSIGLGAQNIFWEEKGAYTGEVSPGMVAELCDYVIIGHSERRKYFNETDEKVNKKLQAAIKINLIPILCIGESLEEYESGKTREAITRQLDLGLRDIKRDHAGMIVFAYEPVWAIGTGRASSAENAASVIGKIIRAEITNLFDEAIGQGVRVLYGGSVTEKNAKDYFLNPEIDGALVGGASLKPGEFLNIVKAAILAH